MFAPYTFQFNFCYFEEGKVVALLKSKDISATEGSFANILYHYLLSSTVPFIFLCYIQDSPFDFGCELFNYFLVNNSKINFHGWLLIHESHENFPL